MKRNKYSAGAVKFALWFMEFRKAIRLLEQGKTFDEILDDGVKVNYRKVQTARAGRFYEVLADFKSIMVKEK